MTLTARWRGLTGMLLSMSPSALKDISKSCNGKKYEELMSSDIEDRSCQNLTNKIIDCKNI